MMGLNCIFNLKKGENFLWTHGMRLQWMQNNWFLVRESVSSDKLPGSLNTVVTFQIQVVWSDGFHRLVKFSSDVLR